MDGSGALGALDRNGLGAVDGQGGVDVERRREEMMNDFRTGMSISQLLA